MLYKRLQHSGLIYIHYLVCLKRCCLAALRSRLRGEGMACLERLTEKLSLPSGLPD
jgi:hypothetical protein